MEHICYHCEEKAHEDDMVRDVNGHYICVICEADQYERCEICEDLFDKDEMLYVGRDSKYYCQPCQREHSIKDPDDYPSWMGR